MPAHQLERHFFAAVADGVVHLAEAAPADATLQRVPVQNPLSRAVGEFHGSTPVEERGSKIEDRGSKKSAAPRSLFSQSDIPLRLFYRPCLSIFDLRSSILDLQSSLL